MTVKANDAAGIGLFRSEFIYLERDTFPTEEEQFNIYRTVAENMAGKPVIIRIQMPLVMIFCQGLYLARILMKMHLQ